MLLEDFYKINKETVSDDTQTTSITLNPHHEIFTGHFPGNPITPGVCMLQIIKELTERRVGCTLFMKKASNVKFMAIINPEKTPDVLIINTSKDLGNEVKVKNTFTYGDTIALKVTVTFIKI